MAAPPLLLLQDVALTFGGTPLFVSASLSVGAGERLCLVGRNGSGKSTLLKMAAGLLEPDAGSRFLQPGTTLRYLEQEPDLSPFPSVAAYVEGGLGPADDAGAIHALLDALGLAGDAPPATLSGGEARRAALARALAPDPDILLLDEPTNHLDLPGIEWLEKTLDARRAALVLVSHDRRFLETLSRTTVWLDRGLTRRLDRGFAGFEDWRDAVHAEEERERRRLDRRIEAELDWVRYGVTARRKRNMGRMRALEELRKTRREARRATGMVRMQASEADASGRLVIEARAVAKSFGGRAVVRPFSTIVHRGDRVGIVGPNGAGKTTLVNLLIGRLTPDEGTVRLGANLELTSIDQGRIDLAPDETLRSALTVGGGDTVSVGGASRHVASYIRDFLFLPEQIDTPVTALSGGERARLLLARAFARPSNLLVLDEPTNDLDLETLDLLAELVADYPGTVLLVSHDRDFLDRTVTSIIAAEGEGRWTEYAGGYSDMLAQRGAPPGAEQAPREKVAPRAAPAPAPPKPKRKLSFREKHDLDRLPAEIERLGREIAGLEARLADPDLFARDPAAFTRAGEALEAARTRLSVAEERWLELELLREELAS